MEERGVNQQWLAEKTGQSTATVSELKRGITSPRIETLEAIAEALGVHTFELLVDSEELRRLTIERALRREPLPNETIEKHYGTPPKVEEIRPRKEAAMRRRKKGVKGETRTSD